MRLLYEHIVKDMKIQISVEDSDDSWVTLKVEGFNDTRIKASDKITEVNMKATPEIMNEIDLIIDTTHQAYIASKNSKF